MVERIKRKIIEEFVQQEIARQVNFCRKSFDLGDDWHPYVLLKFASKTQASEAGRNTLHKPYMILELARFKDKVNGHLEYKDYNTNVFIGSFKSHDWKTCAKALISHELAHCVQYTISYTASSLRDTTSDLVSFAGLGVFLEGADQAHGEFFQNIYRRLRREFVNDSVEPYCQGIDPLPVASIKHPLVGKSFHHVELGKCTVIQYNERAKRYKYKYMDGLGDIYQSTPEVMATDAIWDFYDTFDQ